jgi:pyrophosphatase PpaX
MNKFNIIFDLDGTLLDVSERLYKVYFDLLKKSGFKALSKNRYWSYKRKAIKEEEIVKLTCPQKFIEKYKKERMRKLEKFDYLKFDKLINGARQILKKSSERFSLHLVTERNRPENLEKQLKKLNIKKYFKKIICKTIFSQKNGTKLKLLKQLNFPLDTLIVGDTEKDILVGEKLGFKTCAVAYGLREKSILKKYHPNFLIENLKDIKKILNI